MKIEQSLNQLQQLFIDMAVLVAEQSEMITSIETNIENATGYMKEATTQLKKANKLAKRGRKVRVWYRTVNHSRNSTSRTFVD
jgi:t-SNARE complex subunit (syntaxin)